MDNVFLHISDNHETYECGHRNSDAPNPIRILFASIAVGSGRGQRNSHSLVSSKQITYQNIQAPQC